MNKLNLDGRDCWVSDPVSGNPTDGLIVLHPLLADAEVMARVFGIDAISAAGIPAVSPSSVNPAEWDLGVCSRDAVYLDSSLPNAMRRRWPSLQRWHLLGFSNGAFMAFGLAKAATWASIWQICGTCTAEQSRDPLPPLDGMPVFLTLGASDPLVPVSGNGYAKPLASVVSIYEAAGAVVTQAIEDMGHGLPGSACPPLWPTAAFGGWPEVPPCQSIQNQFIAFVKGLP